MLYFKCKEESKGCEIMSEKKTKKEQSKIQSVARALNIVDILSSNSDGMSLAQISEKMELPKSTVYGLLATLRDFNYVSQDNESGYYLLGTRLFELGNQVARNWDIKDVAFPIMRKLNKQFGETVHLGAEDNGDMLYLEKLESDSLLDISSGVGLRLPMHCSGLGKVLLAEKSPAELKRYIIQKGLTPLTKRTITTQKELEKELARVRKQGYAIDDGEIMEGLRCVGAPIQDANGKVRYAISVSGHIKNMYGKRLDNIIHETIKAADEISKTMITR